MSRNKREGRYAGYRDGKHWRIKFDMLDAGYQELLRRAQDPPSDDWVRFHAGMTSEEISEMFNSMLETRKC